jgi:putative sterol carrier protein
MAQVPEESDDVQNLPWGDHVVPSLAGVHGCIEFVGPRGRAYLRIDGEQCNLSLQRTCEPDCVMSSDLQGELARVVRGEVNAVTALLKGDVEATGNLMLAARIAGSMPELGRQPSTSTSQGAPR